MSDGTDQTQGGERDDDRALAAEYALGLLEVEEARVFEARMARDPALRAFYAEWCEQFVGFAEGEDVPPPANVKAALDAELFAQTSATTSLIRWGFGALVGAAAAAAVAFVSLNYVIPALDQTVLEASLEGEVGVSVSARYESASGELVAARLTGSPGAGRDHELWLILPDQAPVSLGLFGADGRAIADLSGASPDVLVGAVLAVSDEPTGGSTTGAPTGDVLAIGPLTLL